MEPRRISADEVKRRLEAGDRVTFLDARSQAAWEDADEEIPGSIRVPPDDPAAYLDRIPRTGLMVPYCT